MRMPSLRQSWFTSSLNLLLLLKHLYIIIIINLTPFELKAMRVSYKGLKLGKTLLFA